MTTFSLATQSSRTLRLGATGSLILGAAGSASAANVTNGTVVYNANPGTISTTAGAAGLYFDVNEDGTNDFFIQTIKGKAPGRFSSGKAAMGAFAPSPDFLTSFVSNGQELDVASTGFTFGETIGPETIFLGTGPGTSNSAAPISTNNSYYGFSFIDGSTTVYGWMKFSFSAPTLSTPTVSVLEWAYDESGAAITVGATNSVPEVATSSVITGAAALLAGSAAAWRRRRARVPVAL
jgi:hypothetical protein